MTDGHTYTILGYITKYSYNLLELTVYGKSAAKDVLKIFKECVSGIYEDKLLKVSMDSPNVNTSFSTSLNKGENESGTKSPCFTWFLWASYNTQLIQTWRKCYLIEFEEILSAFKIFHETRQDMLTMTCWQKLKIQTTQFCFMVTGG